MTRIKCSNPSCDNIYIVEDVWNKGGINDKGGIIAKCEKCEAYTPIFLNNPHQRYGLEGGTIEDKWKDKLPDYFKGKYKITGNNLPI